MDEKKLTIYFTSDLHGYIYPTDYRGSEEKELGLFKCASRFRKDGNTLVIDGGDILQGSPLGAFCHDTVGSGARVGGIPGIHRPAHGQAGELRPVPGRGSRRPGG